ncbi:MAG: NADH-quinone oxidoreductase subunit A [Candidatus Midichloriaceae bacterium]
MDIQLYLQNYLSILIFIIISACLAFVLIIIPFIINKSNPDKEKLSTYECGFESFGNAKKKFDIRFYLVSILFIIFDLEIAFLFPWAVMLKEIGLIGFWSMIAFIITLTIGFVYEWKKGALEWE